MARFTQARRFGVMISTLFFMTVAGANTPPPRCPPPEEPLALDRIYVQARLIWIGDWLEQQLGLQPYANCGAGEALTILVTGMRDNPERAARYLDTVEGLLPMLQNNEARLQRYRQTQILGESLRELELRREPISQALATLYFQGNDLQWNHARLFLDRVANDDVFKILNTWPPEFVVNFRTLFTLPEFVQSAFPNLSPRDLERNPVVGPEEHQGARRYARPGSAGIMGSRQFQVHLERQLQWRITWGLDRFQPVESVVRSAAEIGDVCTKAFDRNEGLWRMCLRLIPDRVQQLLRHYEESLERGSPLSQGTQDGFQRARHAVLWLQLSLAYPQQSRSSPGS